MYKNKIILSSALAISLTFSGMQCLATTTGIINTETVKMRSKASTDSSIVTLVSEDDKVEILEKSGEWYKVKFGEKTGYIYAEYVTTKDDNNTNDTTTENSETQKEQTNNESTETVSNTNTASNETTASENEEKDNSEEAESTTVAVESKVLIKEETAIKLVPLINSSNIATIKANTTVTVKDYLNGWYYIVSDDSEGWVREEKVNNENEIKEENKAEEEAEETEEKNQEEEEKTKEETTTKYVSTEKVNIREEASTDSKIVKSITKNTAVTVISTSNGWSKVKVGDVEGYISNEYLSNSKVTEESSTSNSTNTTNRTMETSRTASTTSKSGGDVVSYAKSFLGSKYVSGGAGPSSFDCSGFTQYIYKNYGVSLTHSARAQASAGTAVDKSSIQAGDLVLFKGATGSGIGHVGIYIGGGQFIHASNPTGGVKTTSMSDSYYSTRYVTARRVL